MLHRFNPLKEFSTYHHPPLSHNTCQPLHKLIPKTTTTTTKKLSILRISILLYHTKLSRAKPFYLCGTGIEAVKNELFHNPSDVEEDDAGTH